MSRFGLRTMATATAHKTDAYGRAALEREVGRLAMASKGNGNAQLNASAYALGQLVGGGVLQRSEVEDALRRAAPNWLKESEIAARSGAGSKPG